MDNQISLIKEAFELKKNHNVSLVPKKEEPEITE